MVDFFARKKDLKIYMLLLSFVLLFSSFLNSSVSYAAENAPPAQADPSAPQNLRVVADSITATSAKIEWDRNDAISDIDVWYAGTDDYYTWGNNGSRTLTDLKPETTYKLYITWFERPYTLAHKSNIIEFTTPAGEPVKPPAAGATNLKVVEVTHNTVSLTWDAAPGINDYWIWDQNNKYILWANSGAQTVGGLTPNTTYSFYIGPDGIQAPNLTPELKSNLVTFTTTEDKSEYKELPLAPPQHLKVTAVTDSSLTLKWTGSPGADGYDFYVNGKWTSGVWDGSNMVTYTVPDTVTGSVYFEVGAQKTVNKLMTASEKSNKVELIWGQLAAPRDVQVVTANRTTVSLGWAPTPGATSYDIYQDGKLIGSSQSNRYVAAALQEGQSYTFAVAAKNNLWESPKSASISAVPGSNYNIVTYYTSWSVSETARNFKPDQVDVSQVTHINYAFADLCWKKYGTGSTACQNEKIPLQKNYVYDGEIVLGDHDNDIKNFEAFASIKEDNPHLNMMVSVGGWSWSKNFSNMAATEETRRTFANSAVKFLRAYGLDGLDIDWEYPVEGGETHNSHLPEDKQNFTLMMQTVRDALDAAGSEDGKYYLLTIASGQGDNFTVNADFANSVSYLDFINIMTYDYSGSWELLAHHNAPLYADKNHPRDSALRNNVRGGATGHLNGGVPAYKLVLGIPFYGKGWSGCPENGEYQTCTAIPAGSWEAGIFDYSDIENNYINKDGYVRNWNEASKVAFLYNKKNGYFITYNDQTSMIYNASLVKSLDLAGVMSWDISGDRNKTLSTQLVHDLPIDGSVNASALPAPSNLAIIAKTDNELQVKWDAVTGASGYEVYVNNVYAGTVTETKFTESAFASYADYKIHVLAVEKKDAQVLRVSAASHVIVAKTPVTTSPGGGLTPPPAKAKDELDASITKDGDKWTVNVQADAAIKTINAADSATFKVTVGKEAKQADILITKAVIEAIAKKGEMPSISIVLHGVSYLIPVHAIHLSADIKISITAPDASSAGKIEQLSKASGLKVLAKPLDFKIEKLTTGSTYVEVTDFGQHMFSRIFTLSAKDIDVNRATGVVYLPGTDQFRSVPTKFTPNSDGTVAAELIRNGNSIYTIVETSFKFNDVTMEWARKDVERAAAKLIVSGEMADRFGANSAITRGEFISMIVKGLGILPNAADNPFKDVDSNSEFAGDIVAAKKLGLIKGTTKDAFNPNGSITRQDLSVILANALKYAGKTNVADNSVLEHFKDQAAVSSYAKPSVALIVEQQIMLGVSQDTFAPLSKVTKAQAAVTVMRLLDALKLT
ncbi:glycosyl hydrolase family 18 protein [Paenibacillus sp. FJAT-27812]|uniref:glycosyl hydrolase family 18 protein n=1 Tax=Paenibacillus sp. FJAT-27812 TaxID=1684143 RepID=UPI0006A7EDF9|nr:glycosyl hydrolase family 18 protein [Paenibacillus sp. FJAT-27812]